MFRKKDGRKSFSVTKLANTVIPSFFSDTSVAVMNSLHPQRRDMLYNHQLVSKNFHALDENSIFVAGVVDTERLSKSTYKALRKADVLTEEGLVNTTKIGPRFIHQVAMLNAVRQRELINMLFWWEEESHRFSKLFDEDKELSGMITEAETHAAEDSRDSTRKEMVDQLKFARERVRMKIRQRPSQRRSDIEADTDNIMDQFRGRALSAPLGSNSTASVDARSLTGYEGAAMPGVETGSTGPRHYSLAGTATELPGYSER